MFDMSGPEFIRSTTTDGHVITVLLTRVRVMVRVRVRMTCAYGNT